jgi:uncharacterized membrane protein
MSVLVTAADVFVAFLWLGVAAAATSLPGGSPVRVFAALITLLLLPGYALTTVVFPASASRGAKRGQTGTFDGRKDSAADSSAAAISDVERAALSFGLSLGSLPLLGFVADVTFGSYGLGPILTVLTSFLVIASTIGVYRRLRVPENERYVLPIGHWADLASATIRKGDAFERVLNVSLAIVVVTSMAIVGVALVAPQDGEGYTEAGVLAAQPDGEWAAKNYPTGVESGEQVPLMVTVSNEEGQPIEYTVVVLLQRVDDDGTVVEYRELNRFRNRVAPGETWRNPHQVVPRVSGDQLRITYFVYRGTPPATLSRANAYRHVGFRINVSA